MLGEHPWATACEGWKNGDIDTHELVLVAKVLFDGDALVDVLADIRGLDARLQFEQETFTPLWLEAV